METDDERGVALRDADSVTDLANAPAPPTTLREAADAAAARAGVAVHEVGDLGRLADVERLWTETWYPGTDKSPVSRDLMRAMTHVGSYVGAAYDVTSSQLLGAGFAFFGDPDHRHLHSHLAAVTPSAQGRSVGLAVKLHQRAWAQDRGVATVTWTFDPLVRRNAYFNLVKLGATATDYLVDFYGAMDGINRGQGSDRLLVSWTVSGPVLTAGSYDAGDGQQLLGEDDAGLPVAAHGSTESGRPALVLVPHDVERLRVTDPAAARSWRSAVREVLGGLLDSGGRVVGFTRDGSYVVEGGAR